ncbi:ATP-dependent helicase [Microbacterium pseudoresistens]|uniref:ATP-dependent helicase n=1 Tax=Microbacterium pseudoresistens TaxID=640634 RepID=UPI0031E64876
MPEDLRQRDAVLLPVAASGTVIGGPGTGKTHALVERVARLIGAGLPPDELLVLTPSRQAATALRDVLGVRIESATPGPLARSLGSFAFQVVRGAMVADGQEPPALLTGADQDRLLGDILAGDAIDEEHGASRWPDDLAAPVRSSRVFRSELRAFLSECTELGVSPAELSRSPRPAWQAVASFIRDYRRVLDGARSTHRDAADLLAESAAILRSAGPARLGPLGRLRAVLVDDAQELTAGGLAVVAALRARGVAVVAYGDPDISSGAFRGAAPELFARLAAMLGEVHVLDEPHRQNAALTALTRTVTQAIGAGGRVEHRRAPMLAAGASGSAAESGPADPPIAVCHAGSPHEEIDRIAGALREWHLVHGVPWDRMAVIAHDTRQVTQLAVELAAREVPTRAAGVQKPLGDEGVVREILGIVRLALTPPAEREPDALAEALRTPFGGLDGIGLRRLRARLRHRHLAEGGARPARELLRDALAEPAQLTLLDTAEARTADRFGTTLRDVAAAAAPAETIHDLLWRVWDASRGPDGRRLATVWRETAAGPGGAQTGQALDALVALFDAAKRAVERAPENGPEMFIHDVLDSEVPEDSLSAPERPGLVTLLTPAGALGTQFDAVVVAGVQDGVWPNVRLRGSLLETWRLAGAIEAARAGEPEHEHGAVDRRRAALHDELRLFVRAISRTRERLLVTAVDDDDHTPSPFFAFLPDPEPLDEGRRAHPLTLRGLVAGHRRVLTVSTDPQQRAEAAGQLAILAREGVPGAAPEQWYGMVEPSGDAPLRDLAHRSVKVSPSKLESFEECGLNWAVSALGGDTVLPPSAGIGTIVHEALERVPDGDLEAMRAIVAERWPELDFEAEWVGRKERQRADTLVERLHGYLAEVAHEGGRVIAAETPFRFAVDIDEARTLPDEEAQAGAAIVSGIIDRVEAYPRGSGEHADARGQTWRTMLDAPDADDEGERVVVVDLKTGKHEPETEAAVSDHAQLAAYQIAVALGLIEGADADRLAGARLVLVSRTTSKSEYRVAHQHTLDAEARSEFLRRVAEAGRGMAASPFIAQVDTHCTDTPHWVPACRIHTVPAASA